MLGSITPLGERGRNSRWWVTVTAFVLGGATGGALLGGALGWIGSVARAEFGGWSASMSLVALGAIALIGAAFDLGVMPFALPTVRRQVDERWLHRYRGWVYGLGFGVQLGLGLVTIVITAAVYATFAASLLSGSAITGAAIGGTFGLARAATSLSVAGVTRPDQLPRLDARLRRMDRPSRRIATTMEIAVAAGALAVGLFAW